MLIEFKFKNFRSFRDEQVLSLVASNYDKELIENVRDPKLPGLSNVKLLTGAAIFGSNASGKSNVVNAVRFVLNFVDESANSYKPGDPIPVEPFRLDRASAKMPSSFSVAFIADGIRYHYSFSTTQQRVLNEELVAFPKGVSQQWFSRTWNAKAKQYDWSKSTVHFRHDSALREKTRDNALFVSTGAQFNHLKLTPVYNWFSNYLRVIRLEAERGFPYFITVELVKKNKTMLKRVLSILAKADVGTSGALFEDEETPVETLKSEIPPSMLEKLQKEGTKSLKSPVVKLTHKGSGVAPVPFDWDDESAGTQRLFSLLGPWLDTLRRGYTVFIDELECSLHPRLVREILRMLFSKQLNRKGAQIIFTSHNSTLLDANVLRRDQIWFTEKRADGSSFLFPVTDFKPRNDERLERSYMAGRFGGVPYIPAGLI